MLADLSHEVVDGMTTYPGIPAPRLRVVVARETSVTRLRGGASFEIEEVALVGNTGTYVDAPYHYYPDRADVAGLALERLVNVPIVVVRSVDRRSVTAAALGDPDLLRGRAVLLHTGWDRHWGTDRYLDTDCSHLTADAVALLVRAGAAVVGIDSLNIDDPTDLRRPAHAGLLGAEIPIIEHLTNLGAVPDTGACLTALPAPVRGMASFPVRAVATWHDD
ncbi:cyclase family protein [Plantactinospora sp. KLBMP9567]|uniref:cyclase family protein n=1 Tax=Plantactinospora sp. KLBMP9567 TaxID=3085900 RepID=UPI002980C13D|nr:cyclase family protein [Plantactinospora sp. KLBMP9567]MDW5329519.1 cyclase family protein [Plantactinospora sp. KLBMP9567]